MRNIASPFGRPFRPVGPVSCAPGHVARIRSAGIGLLGCVERGRGGDQANDFLGRVSLITHPLNSIMLWCKCPDHCRTLEGKTIKRQCDPPCPPSPQAHLHRGSPGRLPPSKVVQMRIWTCSPKAPGGLASAVESMSSGRCANRCDQVARSAPDVVMGDSQRGLHTV